MQRDGVVALGVPSAPRTVGRLEVEPTHLTEDACMLLEERVDLLLPKLRVPLTGEISASQQPTLRRLGRVADIVQGLRQVFERARFDTGPERGLGATRLPPERLPLSDAIRCHHHPHALERYVCTHLLR
jgi:hypothetical protein